MGGVPTLDEEDVEEQEVIVDVVSRGATIDSVFPSVDDPTDVTEWSFIISWMCGCNPVTNVHGRSVSILGPVTIQPMTSNSGKDTY